MWTSRDREVEVIISRMMRGTINRWSTLQTTRTVGTTRRWGRPPANSILSRRSQAHKQRRIWSNRAVRANSISIRTPNRVCPVSWNRSRWLHRASETTATTRRLSHMSRMRALGRSSTYLLWSSPFSHLASWPIQTSTPTISPRVPSR